MLTQNFTATSGGTCTKPGSTGARQFNLTAPPSSESLLRRYAATALTVPLEMVTSHQIVGTAYKARIRSMLKFQLKDLTKDPTLTGGIIPSAAAYLVIDRPVNSGGAIINAQVDDLVGWLIDTITQSGVLASFYNQEQ